MKVGDRVKMSPMWKHDEAIGTITKITKDGYVVVKWDDINGEWFWTPEQAQLLKLV